MSMHHQQHEHRRPSSFWMQDAECVFSSLALNAGDVFLDLGCGIGEYARYAANQVGASGVVYALEKSETLIADLTQHVRDAQISNIIPMVADMTETLPIQSGAVDVCLVATVLHIPDIARHTQAVCTEIHRVLKPGGRLAVIECSMKDLSFGPPPHLRISPAALHSMVTSCNFTMLCEVDLGFNYLMQFASR